MHPMSDTIGQPIKAQQQHTMKSNTVAIILNSIVIGVVMTHPKRAIIPRQLFSDLYLSNHFILQYFK